MVVRSVLCKYFLESVVLRAQERLLLLMLGYMKTLAWECGTCGVKKNTKLL